MFRDDTDILWEKYESLFDSPEKKAKAFDKLARNYYQGNFGSMSKSDIDVLMFSIYLEEILERSEEDISTYSDYTLSHQLGITQSRVSNLKQKKQLQYPYDRFKWQTAFERCCKNARPDGGKIKINLRDINLFYELKNQIDENGGYVETSLTRNLLIISPSDFFTLTESIMTDEEKNELKKEIRKQYSNNKDLIDSLEKESISKAISTQFKETMPSFLADILVGVVTGGPGIAILKAALNAYLGH